MISIRSFQRSIAPFITSSMTASTRPSLGAALSPTAAAIRAVAVALFVSSLLLGGTTAFAADDDEARDPNALAPYIEYMAGVSFIPYQTVQGADGSGAGLMGRAEPKLPGYFFGGAVGTRFMEHFRGELSLGFRSSEVENIAIQGETSDSKGDLDMFSVMANAYYDFDLGIGVVPWIGAGIGWGMPRLDVQNKSTTMQLSIDDTDSVFVWNAMVGATVPFNEVTSLSLGYRYIQTEDISYESRVTNTVPATPTSVARRLDFEFDAHEVYLGLRFSF